MPLLREIRRRKVFQVAAVYAVVAWLIVQVVGAVVEPLNLPGWVDTLVIVLLAVGFPIALVLAWAFELTPDGIVAASDKRPREISGQPIWLRIGCLSQVLVVIAVGFLVVDQYVFSPGAGVRQSQVRNFPFTESDAEFSPRYNIVLGPIQRTREQLSSAQVSLSPDGRRLAYSIPANGRQQLFVRELDQLSPRSIEVPGNAFAPRFSPDGEWILISDLGGQLIRVPLRGGQARVLTRNSAALAGADWGVDDSILFLALDDGSLHRIPAQGGDSQRIGIVPPEGFVYAWPDRLPDAAEVLVTVAPRGSMRTGYLARLNIESGDIEPLVEEAYNARYLASGHIVFMRDAALWAVPYDASRGEIVGREVPVIQDVETASTVGVAGYAISPQGSLVYVPGIDVLAEETQTLVWVDHTGAEEPLTLRRKFRWSAISPNGDRIAVGVDEGGNEDIWIYDLDRTILSRLTFDPATDALPLWTPDGERIVFTSERGDGGLYWRSADGTGQAEPLLTDQIGALPLTFTPDGTQLIYSAGTPPDLFVLSMDGTGEAERLTTTSYPEVIADISPDGNWIAYQSGEFGRPEIFVQPFPDLESGKWQVSSEGGTMPRWSPKGDAIYYRWGNATRGTTVWSVPFDATAGVVTSTPAALFSGAYVRGSSQSGFDVSPVDERFLLMRDTVHVEQVPGQTVLVVVENWFAELRQLAPPAE